MAAGGGGELHFEFDQVTVNAIEKKLGRMKSEAPKVLKNALNQTAKDARTELWAKANETYTVKKGGFNKDMKLKPANTGNLMAILQTRGAPIEMIKFKVRGRKGTPTVEILKGQARSMGSRSFVNNIAHGGKHIAVAKYIGGKDSRLKIEKKFSVSSPVMIGNKKRVYGVVEPHILENLQKNVNQQILKVLGG